MSRSWMTIVLFLAGAEPAFASAKKVGAGVDCRESPQEALERLAEDVARAKDLAEHAGRDCLDKDDPRREADEQRELERIEKKMKSEIDDICTKKSCVGNPTALATRYDPYNVFNTFGGCS